jgi:hypothetical protein
MAAPAPEPESVLCRSLESGRVHSAYLLSGPPETTRAAALRFVRALVCEAGGERRCEAWSSCRRSGAASDMMIDGTGKLGFFF